MTYTRTDQEAACGISLGDLDVCMHSHAQVPYVDPRRYGYVGDGVVDDWDAIQRAVAVINALGGGTLWFPPSTPLIFAGSRTGTLCYFHDLRVVRVLGHGVQLTVDPGRVITASIGQCFLFADCDGVVVDGFTTEAPALNVSSSIPLGVEFVTVERGTRNVHLGVNRVKNWQMGLKCANQVAGEPGPESARCRNITVDVLDIENCWYGILNQFSGDRMEVRNLRTNRVHRSFFSYGASGIEARVFSRNPQATDVLLGALKGQECSAINLQYHSLADSSECSSAPKVQLLFSGSSGQLMRNINIDLRVEYPQEGLGGPAFEIHKVDANGNAVGADHAHALDGLTVSGLIRGQGASTSGSGTVLTNFSSTWSNADRFSNVSLENLTIQALNAGGIPRLCLGGAVDSIGMRSVVSNVPINIRRGNSDGLIPQAGIQASAVSCPNLSADVTDSNGNLNASLIS